MAAKKKAATRKRVPKKEVAKKKVARKKAPRKSPEDVERASTRAAKARMVTAMGETKGNVSLACERAEVGRRTHYRWIREDHQYAEDVEKVVETVVDAIETLFLKTMSKSKSEHSMKWFLERRKPELYAKIGEKAAAGALQGEGGSISLEFMRDEFPDHSLIKAMQDVIDATPELHRKPKK